MDVKATVPVVSARQAAEQNVLLDGLAAGEADRARAFAAQVRAVVTLAALMGEVEDEAGVELFAQLELAGTCRLGQSGATRRLVEAQRLADALPLTLSLLEAGAVFEHQARVLLDVTLNCTPAVARLVEARAWDARGQPLCPADLRRSARRAVLACEAELDCRAAERRARTARAARRTWAYPEPDGMGQAGALLPAEQLRRWALDLDTLGRRLADTDQAGGIVRTADQRRADLFAALPGLVLAQQDRDRAPRAAAPPGTGPSSPAPASPAACGCGGAGAVPVLAPGVLINVHVPVTTVLERGTEPAHLDGYGPISAEHVRLLRPAAWLRRIDVDSHTGQPIRIDPVLHPPADHGADPQGQRGRLLALLTPTVACDRAEARHDPSAALARLVDLRDRRCDGPGCSATTSGRQTERDHQQPWPGGPTAAWNLKARSPRCHHAKHTGWAPRLDPDGSTTWTSPLGRVYWRPAAHDQPVQPREQVDGSTGRDDDTATAPTDIAADDEQHDWLRGVQQSAPEQPEPGQPAATLRADEPPPF